MVTWETTVRATAISSGLPSKINTLKEVFTDKCVYIFQEYEPCLWNESLGLGKDCLKTTSGKLLQIRSQCNDSSITCTTRISVQEMNYCVCQWDWCWNGVCSSDIKDQVVQKRPAKILQEISYNTTFIRLYQFDLSERTARVGFTAVYKYLHKGKVPQAKAS